MKILVTGAAGFIGSNLVKHLSKSHEVIAIDNMFRGLHKKDVIEADITTDISNHFKGVDIVYHLAAMSSVRISEENPEKCFLFNVYGTYNVARMAAENGVKKIVFSSSREVYGDPKSLPVKESAEISPINVYGNSKMLAERTIKNICETSEMDYTIFRIANVYGSGDKGRIIPLLIEKANDESEISIFGGDQVLDFIHIEDVIRAMTEYAEDNAILNLGSGVETTIKDIIDIVEKLSGKKIKKKNLAPNPYEVMKFAADISEIEKLGFKPEIDLEKGIKRLFDQIKS